MASVNLGKVRQALRITTEDFDDEINDLIEACLSDLRVAGVDAEESDPLILRAEITYVKANFGDEMANYEKFKSSYDEQKAQMSMRTGYTEWISQ